MTDAPKLIALGDPAAIACEGDACAVPEAGNELKQGQ